MSIRQITERNWDLFATAFAKVLVGLEVFTFLQGVVFISATAIRSELVWKPTEDITGPLWHVGIWFVVAGGLMLIRLAGHGHSLMAFVGSAMGAGGCGVIGISCAIEWSRSGQGPLGALTYASLFLLHLLVFSLVVRSRHPRTQRAPGQAA